MHSVLHVAELELQDINYQTCNCLAPQLQGVAGPNKLASHVLDHSEIAEILYSLHP